MKKIKTTRVTLELTQAEYDHIWDILYAISEYPRTTHQNEYLSADDVKFAHAFVHDGPLPESK
jgi:hypothetical protein